MPVIISSTILWTCSKVMPPCAWKAHFKRSASNPCKCSPRKARLSTKRGTSSGSILPVFVLSARSKKRDTVFTVSKHKLRPKLSNRSLAWLTVPLHSKERIASCFSTWLKSPTRARSSELFSVVCIRLFCSCCWFRASSASISFWSFSFSSRIFAFNSSYWWFWSFHFLPSAHNSSLSTRSFRLRACRSSFNLRYSSFCSRPASFWPTSEAISASRSLFTAFSSSFLSNC
mmetsp:Transcript_52104/g.106972  ORF Transcript_52104/g.106972 Transcript_52104/m.106972 type:complete len:230 (-) Transcript_52104:663-1352(-)